MPDPVDAVLELTSLLDEVGARPVLVRERIAPSTLYDRDYHIAVVACAFAIHAKPAQGGQRRMLASWLKLLQFVAARPRLVPDLRAWAETRRDADLDTWRKMPRGYLGDRTHDGVIQFLVAADVLHRDRDAIASGTQISMLDNLYDRIKADTLLLEEQRVLTDLLTVHPNKTMMAGA